MRLSNSTFNLLLASILCNASAFINPAAFGSRQLAHTQAEFISFTSLEGQQKKKKKKKKKKNADNGSSVAVLEAPPSEDVGEVVEEKIPEIVETLVSAATSQNTDGAELKQRGLLQARLAINVAEMAKRKALNEATAVAKASEEEVAKKAAEETAVAKAAAEEAAAIKATAEEAAAIKAAAEEAAAAKAAAEEAAAIKAAEEEAAAAKAAAIKAAEEEAAAAKAAAIKAAEEEAAAIKAAEEAAAIKAAEEKAARIAAEKEKQRIYAGEMELKQRGLLQAKVAHNAAEAAKRKAEQEAFAARLAEMEAKREAEKARIESYGAMSADERAFNILLDLGLIQASPDPDSEDYDHSNDDELAPENVF